MVFQQFNLFPHMTVLQNITFAPVKLGLMNQQDAEKKQENCSPESDLQTRKMLIRHSFPVDRSSVLLLCALWL